MLLFIRYLRCPKIQGTYFKISALYFKIYGLYFSAHALCFLRKADMAFRTAEIGAPFLHVNVISCKIADAAFGLARFLVT